MYNIIIYLFSFVISQFFNILGKFISIKYPTMSFIKVYLYSVPFTLLAFYLSTYAIYIGDKFNIATPIQDTYMLIINQFIFITLLSIYWLNKNITRSDVVTFFIILLGFYVSYSEVVSEWLGLKSKPQIELKQEIENLEYDYEFI